MNCHACQYSPPRRLRAKSKSPSPGEQLLLFDFAEKTPTQEAPAPVRGTRNPNRKAKPISPFKNALGRPGERIGGLLEFIHRMETDQRAPERGCFAKNENIADFLRISVRSVYDYKSELLEKGLIEKRGKDFFTTEAGRNLIDAQNSWRGKPASFGQLQQSEDMQSDSESLQVRRDDTANLQALYIPKANTKQYVQGTPRRKSTQARPTPRKEPTRQRLTSKMQKQSSGIGFRASDDDSWVKDLEQGKRELRRRMPEIHFQTFVNAVKPGRDQHGLPVFLCTDSKLAHHVHLRYEKDLAQACRTPGARVLVGNG